MNDIIPYVDYCKFIVYNTKKASAFIEINKFNRLLNTVNSIIGIYSIQFPKKLTIISELKSQIRDNSKGVRGEGGYIDIDESDNFKTSVTNDQLCKGIYRKLASVMHPDKGGDKEEFQILLSAYRNRDHLMLRILYEKLNVSYDIEFWVYVADRIKVKYRELQSLEKFRIVQFHISKKTELAREAMADYLDKVVFSLTSELRDIINGQSNQ